jgi:hypothetical protein
MEKVAFIAQRAAMAGAAFAEEFFGDLRPFVEAALLLLPAQLLE